ncbi:MAG: ompR [Chitinophagaceae bacterium]|nr:ompR [Chitinophagaceae bacterium]
MKYNVLVVDDNEEDIFFFKRALSATALEVDLSSTYDGSKAIELVTKEPYDCIFLDYNMPGYDGLEVLKKIRQTNSYTPVVMLTGQKDQQMIIKLMQEGANDYLSKDSLSSESLRISLENARRIYLMKQEKYQAEKALKNSEARLAEAQRIGHIGNWEFDTRTKSFVLSDEAMRISESYHDNKRLLNFCRKIHYKDFHLFKETIKNLEVKQTFDITFRYLRWAKNENCINLKGTMVSENKIIGTIQDVTKLKSALLEAQKASIKTKATKIVLAIAIVIFLLSEAVLDPVIDSLTASLIISLSFKGSIAVALKPIESLLERIMMSRVSLG